MGLYSHVGDRSVNVEHIKLLAGLVLNIEGETSLSGVLPVGDGVGVLLLLSHWESNL